MGYEKGVGILIALALSGCGDRDKPRKAEATNGSQVEEVADPRAELARKILILDAALQKLEREVAELRASAEPDGREIAEREAKIEALQMTLRQSKIKMRTLELDE